MRKKIYILFCLLGMAVFIVCLVTGALYHIDALILAGAGICAGDFVIVAVIYFVNFVRAVDKELKENAKKERAAEDDERLSEEINNTADREENMIARAKYYGAEADSSAELLASSFGFSKSNRQAFKDADIKDKLKVIALFGSLGLLILTMFAGIACANIGGDGGFKNLQTAGFALMGVGGGGFFLVIASFGIKSVFERRSYYSGKKSEKRDRFSSAPTIGGRVRTGVVTKCELHSQTVSGNRIQRVSNTLYQIWVFTGIGDKKIRFLCSRRYNIGDKVEYYEYKFKKCKLIESDPVSTWGKK